MIILGISEGYHDAGVTILNDTEIVHASHSERYMGVKNYMWTCHAQLSILPEYDTKAYYEKPLLKNLRRFSAGQKWQSCKTKYDVSFPHHMSHAAAGYYTAPFDDCNIIVVDAIGEFDTVSLWDNMKKIK